MFLSVLLLCVSLNLDALCVGLTYGVRKIRIPCLSKIILFVLSAFFSMVAIFCGRWLLLYFPPLIAKLIGALILLLLGLFTVIKALLFSPDGSEETNYKVIDFSIKQVSITIKIMKNPVACDMNLSCSIEPKEALYLGVALSIDALAAGIAASMNGINHIVIPFIIAIFQFLFLSAGRFLGTKFENRFQIKMKTINMIAGAMLILLSIIRMVF